MAGGSAWAAEAGEETAGEAGTVEHFWDALEESLEAAAWAVGVASAPAAVARVAGWVAAEAPARAAVGARVGRVAAPVLEGSATVEQTAKQRGADSMLPGASLAAAASRVAAGR